MTQSAFQLPDFSHYTKALDQMVSMRVSGRVTQVVGLLVEAKGLDCKIGEVCHIENGDQAPLIAEVVGFRDDRILLMPLGDMQGIKHGSAIYPQGSFLKAPVGDMLLGRVLDGLGNPLDGEGPLGTDEFVPIYNLAPHPLQRQTITEPLVTGIRAIDGLNTCGKGQRIGVFAGSGVGKSTLLGEIARNSRSDISVIALIGERGREVREFIERDLGPEGLERSVLVISTSDQPALVRIKAAWVAMTIAENFRAQGKDVTFLMDSVTRFAMAQREVGLALGEPPASKGYTPSVFALLPQLLERAGMGAQGSITGFFTVLVEGDDFNEPISDAVRSILDGHIMLTRELAIRNHYPAIDVLQSISRVMPEVTDPGHRAAAGQFRKLLATYEKARDLINIGAYVDGSDPEIDAAVLAKENMDKFLQQQRNQFTDFSITAQLLQMIGANQTDGEEQHAA